MRYRYSIPLMLCLVLFASVIGWQLDFNLLNVVILGTAILFALDAKTLGVRRFRGTMGQPTLVVGVITLVAWPLAFPMYLALRRRVRDGIAPERTEADRRIAPGWVAAILVLMVAQGFFWVRTNPLLAEAQALAGVAARAAMSGANVTLNGEGVTVTLGAQLATDSAVRQQIAEDVARSVLVGSPRATTTDRIRVRFVSQEQRGSVTMTSEELGFEWSASRLAGDGTGLEAGDFSGVLDGLQGADGPCEARGGVQMWRGEAGRFGHAMGTFSCPTAVPTGEIYLRLLSAGTEPDAPRRLLVALSRPGAATPCSLWGQCACDLPDPEAEAPTEDVFCSLGDDASLNVTLPLR